MAVSLSLMHCCCPCPPTAAAAAAARAGTGFGATALQRRRTTTTTTAAKTHHNSGSSTSCSSSSSSASWNCSCSPPTGSVSIAGCHRVSSSSVRSTLSFTGADSRRLNGAVWSAPGGRGHGSGSGSRPVVAMAKPVIQFIRGINEQVVPDVKLTRSRDGSNGVASFIFDQPSVFDQSRELGDITGIYMIDDEGVLTSVDVSAKFVNGKPAKIEARYVMRNIREWDRFMRFMERYANENELGFVKS